MRTGIFKLKAKEPAAIDLAEILTLYLTWFGSGATGEPALNGKTGKDQPVTSGESQPRILQIENLTRQFLFTTLPPEIPVDFALSLIESVAYTTSKFAAADQLNAPLYRAAAWRILKGGLNQFPKESLE